jgi:putative nucleotidyltransferase with HDIG domain
VPKKQISIDELALHMYVVGCDRSWLETPFLTHRFVVQDREQIEALRNAGVRLVTIDTDHGADVMPGERPGAPPNGASAERAPKNGAETPAVQPSATAAPAMPGEVTSLAKEFSYAREARREVIQQVDRMFSHVRETGQVDGEQVAQVVQNMIAQELHRHATFLALIKMRAFDHSLCDHGLSVCALALMMGHELGCTPGQLSHLAAGALLHDIGLLQLPPHILQQRHALSAADKAVYDQHPQMGMDVLAKSDGFAPEVLEIVAAHHRTTADSTSSKIAMLAQAVQVVDRYDELLTGQRNGIPLPSHQALSNLYQQASDGQFDVTVVSKLIRRIGVYPLYSLVELSTGEHGLVTAIPPGKSHQPVVRLLLNRQGQRINPPVTIDFSADPTLLRKRSIVRILDVDTEGLCVEELLETPAA